MTKFLSKDFLLQLLYSPGVESTVNEPIAGRTRITKAVFLFNKEIWKEWQFNALFPTYAFEPWLYGPYSADIFNDIEFFRKIGFVGAKTIEDSIISLAAVEEYERYQEDSEGPDDSSISEFEEEEFYLSQLGMSYVQTKELFDALSDGQKDILKEFKKRINLVSLDELLRYVYTKYPETTDNSKIREKFL